MFLVMIVLPTACILMLPAFYLEQASHIRVLRDEALDWGSWSDLVWRYVYWCVSGAVLTVHACYSLWGITEPTSYGEVWSTPIGILGVELLVFGGILGVRTWQLHDHWMSQNKISSLRVELTE